MLTRRFTLLLLLVVVVVQILMSIYTNLPFACITDFVDSSLSKGEEVRNLLSKKNRKLNVLYGLSGNTPEFIAEFGVSLKSVLLNAPLDADMDVHLIVDASAYHAAVKLLRLHTIKGSIWRNQIHIIFYIVSEEKKSHYENHVIDVLPVKNVTTGKRVGPGGLFRLFSYEILPADTAPVLYLDNDVVIFANLNEINSIIDDRYMYQVGVGKDVCSGLMIINLQRFQDFWGYLSQVSARRIPTNSGRVGDQLLLHRVKELLRNRNLTLIGDLPKEWHVHLAHGFRRKAHLLRVKRPRIGMMHFNGKRDNDEVWWEGGIWRYCDEGDCQNNTSMQQDFRESWNLAEYYVHQPWSMAKYMGMSYAGEAGKALKISTRCAANEVDCNRNLSAA